MAQAPSGGKPVSLTSLPAEQLMSIREQFEAEMENFSQSSLALQRVAADVASSGRAIEHLKEQKAGQEMLVPLTQSLYVPGELADTDHVLVDIGTGYFVEQKTMDQGVDYCKRKVNLIAENLNKISKGQAERQQMLMAVDQALQSKQAAPSGSREG